MAKCDCYPWPDKCPYCGEGQPMGTKAETASQIVGAFLMMHNVAPWEADELVRWLADGGYKITADTLTVPNGDRGSAAE